MDLIFLKGPVVTRPHGRVSRERGRKTNYVGRRTLLATTCVSVKGSEKYLLYPGLYPVTLDVSIVTLEDMSKRTNVFPRTLSYFCFLNGRITEAYTYPLLHYEPQDRRYNTGTLLFQFGLLYGLPRLFFLSRTSGSLYPLEDSVGILGPKVEELYTL